MPTYTHLRWEAGPEGWELWAVETFCDFTDYESIELVAWIYKNHNRGTWQANVYDGTVSGGEREFDSLEEAQAWCAACVRVA